MKRVTAATLKTKCLNIIDAVQKTQEPVVITKRGKPIVKLAPIESAEKQIFGRLKRKVKIVGDIESPVEPPEAWEVLR